MPASLVGICFCIFQKKILILQRNREKVAPSPYLLFI